MFSPAGYRALREGAALVERVDRGRLLLTGTDRRSLLQGLLTNDIAALQPGSGCYAALLTANGRMIADMRVLELAEGLVLDLARPLVSAMYTRLDDSIFTEDVQVRDISGDGVLLGVYGPAAAATLANAAGDAGLAAVLDGLVEHASRTQAIAGAGVTLVRSAEIGVDGFDLLVASDAAEAVRSALRSAGAVDVDRETTEVTRVEAGRPLFPVDMNEDTIPLEAGIESRAISLTKGCYVGQEIIIRILHRGGGRVARRLVGLEMAAGAAVPPVGASVSSQARAVGVVTSAVQSPALGRAIALATVHRDVAEPGTDVTVGDAAAPAVVHALPFVRAAVSSHA
jgi:tRNA-modifying protein YgfZ